MSKLIDNLIAEAQMKEAVKSNIVKTPDTVYDYEIGSAVMVFGRVSTIVKDGDKVYLSLEAHKDFAYSDDAFITVDVDKEDAIYSAYNTMRMIGKPALVVGHIVEKRMVKGIKNILVKQYDKQKIVVVMKEY